MQGVIADWSCTQAMVRNGRQNTLRHNHSCSLMKNFTRDAYGLITGPQQFYKLEDAGNRRILELLKNTPDKDNLKVIVSGEIQGNTIKVVNISLL